MSQLQEPYSSVGYLCERTPFLSVLKLKHPSLLENEPHNRNQGSEELSWTAWDVCEGKIIHSDSKHVIFCKFLRVWESYVHQSSPLLTSTQVMANPHFEPERYKADVFFFFFFLLSTNLMTKTKPTLQ